MCGTCVHLFSKLEMYSNLSDEFVVCRSVHHYSSHPGIIRVNIYTESWWPNFKINEFVAWLAKQDIEVNWEKITRIGYDGILVIVCWKGAMSPRV